MSSYAYKLPVKSMNILEIIGMNCFNILIHWTWLDTHPTQLLCHECVCVFLIKETNIIQDNRILFVASGPRPLQAHNIKNYSRDMAADWGCHCPACRTTLIATRFRVAVICPIIQVPHCIRVVFYFVWFVFINHIFQFYNELCTYCYILDIYLS